MLPGGGNSIATNCSVGLLGDQLKDDGSCCSPSCGCWCASWVAFETDFCDVQPDSSVGHGTFFPSCNPSYYNCVPNLVSPAPGGSCSSPSSGCHLGGSSSTAFQGAGFDFFRFTNVGAGAAGFLPLVSTGGWVLFFTGLGFFGFPIQVWINVAFQPLQVPPNCTVPGSTGCCCDGTNFPCNVLTGTLIPRPMCSPPTFYSTDLIWPTPDSTIHCNPPSGDGIAC